MSKPFIVCFRVDEKGNNRLIKLLCSNDDNLVIAKSTAKRSREEYGDVVKLRYISINQFKIDFNFAPCQNYPLFSEMHEEIRERCKQFQDAYNEYDMSLFRAA